MLTRLLTRLGLRRCEHPQVRCIHGDEILSTMRLFSCDVARVRCLHCGRALHGRALPENCSYTGASHGLARWRTRLSLTPLPDGGTAR